MKEKKQWSEKKQSVRSELFISEMKFISAFTLLHSIHSRSAANARNAVNWDGMREAMRQQVNSETNASEVDEWNAAGRGGGCVHFIHFSTHRACLNLLLNEWIAPALAPLSFNHQLNFVYLLLPLHHFAQFISPSSFVPLTSEINGSIDSEIK